MLTALARKIRVEGSNRCAGGIPRVARPSADERTERYFAAAYIHSKWTPGENNGTRLIVSLQNRNFIEPQSVISSFRLYCTLNGSTSIDDISISDDDAFSFKVLW